MGARPGDDAGLDLAGSRVLELLDALAAPQHVAGGGPAAAICAAMAAAIVTKVARASRREWVDAGGVAAQAVALRAQALSLASSDAAAYGRARSVLVRTEPTRSAYGGPTGPGAVPIPDEERTATRAAALGDACDVPLAIAEIAAEIVALASEAARVPDRPLAADAHVAMTLAGAAARGAAELVEVKRMLTEDDPRRARARAAVAACEVAQAPLGRADAEGLP